MLVGIVGKPNVGKSTFFSAATLVEVPIAEYPFTTIEPNHGIGYVRVKCVCKEFGVKDNPVNSICVEGNRFIPVELVDCAGLVPDAWKGRGLGNKFLDEVRRADALIHIVDASGSTDAEGRPCRPGERDPLDDIAFLEREITMWMYSIVQKDWKKLVKLAKLGGKDFSRLLEQRLSGLGVRKEHILLAAKEASLSLEEVEKWKEQQIVEFVSALREQKMPMLIAANKIDKEGSEDNYRRIKEAGYPVVPCCAEAELALRRAAKSGLIRYLPGDPEFEILEPSKLTERQKRALQLIKEKILDVWGTTGVQDAINKAFFDLLNAIVVYPVEDEEKLTDHKGNVLPDAYLVPKGTTAKQLAYMIHTELGEGFIYAVDVRTKRRLGESYELKDGDVIKIVSAKARA